MNNSYSKKIFEINNTKYGQDNVSCEPTKEEIEKAVDDGNIDKRSFQGNLEELKKEWEGKDEEKYEAIREYHCRRIAYFVVNKWNEPIKLKRDGKTISDGLHRFKAALFLGYEYVDVVIE